MLPAGAFLRPYRFFFRHSSPAFRYRPSEETCRLGSSPSQVVRYCEQAWPETVAPSEQGGTLSALPEHVQAFIAEHITSVAQLELLLLLRSRASDELDADEVARTLYTSPDMMAVQLAELEGHGLLVSRMDSTRVYRYQPRSAELKTTVSHLAEMYKERRVSVISAIYAGPVDRVRTFADAFKLRRET
jgi:hypothetical protein